MNDHENHYKALIHYYSCLDDVFIFICDDWNCKHIRDGTMASIQKLNLKVLCQKEIRLNFNNIQTADNNGWWNGIYVAILQKNQ